MVNLAEKTTQWVKNGAAEPVGDYLDQWGLRDRVRPQALKEWTNANGKIQGFPYSGFSWPVWYDTDLLKKAGIDAPPTTVDELIADSAKLRDAKIGSMVVGGNDWSGQKLFMQIIQQYLAPEDAQQLFIKGGYCANPGAMKGIDLFVRLRDGGVFVKDVQGFTADLMNSAYYNRDAAIMSAGSWAFGSTPAKVAASTVLGGFPVPNGGSYSKPTAMHGYTGTGIFVSPNGKKKIGAVEAFVKEMYDPTTVQEFVSEAGTVPALVTEGKAKASSPLLQQAVTQLDERVTYAVMPDTAIPGNKADAVIRATSAAYASEQDAQKICSGLDAAYN